MEKNKISKRYQHKINFFPNNIQRYNIIMLGQKNRIYQAHIACPPNYYFQLIAPSSRLSIFPKQVLPLGNALIF
jgi:hypothetical protein